MTILSILESALKVELLHTLLQVKSILLETVHCSPKTFRALCFTSLFSSRQNLWVMALKIGVGMLVPVPFSLSDISVLGKLSRAEAEASGLLSLLLSSWSPSLTSLGKGNCSLIILNKTTHKVELSSQQLRLGERKEPSLLNYTYPECSLSDKLSSLSNRWRQDRNYWCLALSMKIVLLVWGEKRTCVFGYITVEWSFFLVHFRLRRKPEGLGSNETDTFCSY